MHTIKAVLSTIKLQFPIKKWPFSDSITLLHRSTTKSFPRVTCTQSHNMKPHQQAITLWEKLDYIPASLSIIIAAIVAMVTGLWRSDRDAPSYYLHVAFAVLRKCSERFSPRQMEWALPLTDQVYNNHARSAGVVPQTVELCDGAKGHWVGDKHAQTVLIWYHGMNFSSIIGSFSVEERIT